jgi:hypothetical protein
VYTLVVEMEVQILHNLLVEQVAIALFHVPLMMCIRIRYNKEMRSKTPPLLQHHNYIIVAQSKPSKQHPLTRLQQSAVFVYQRPRYT